MCVHVCVPQMTAAVSTELYHAFLLRRQVQALAVRKERQAVCALYLQLLLYALHVHEPLRKVSFLRGELAKVAHGMQLIDQCRDLHRSV